MKDIYTLGDNFVRQHDFLLQMAKFNEVAICGGCAAAISKGRTDYIPADIDLVTTKANALRFVDAINHFLLDKQVHYRIYVNSHNDFVPTPAVGHFRIQCPFWVPVCLFIIPHNRFRFYRIQGGHLLQLPQDVKQAADALTKTDQKPRLANEEAEEWDDVPFDKPAPEEPEENRLYREFWDNDEPFEPIDFVGRDRFESDPLDAQHYTKPL
jgi:hypothetical protein